MTVSSGSGPPQRVFVSSVVEGLQEYREAARRAIERVGMEPVLVNEDFPSSPSSSRNACLDGVESSDIFLLLIDRRGGFRTPSGKPVVQEEFEHALHRKLPAVAFIREGDLDETARHLADRVSDYVEGLFRKTFESPQQLGELVKAALQLLRASGEVLGMHPQSDHLNEAAKKPLKLQFRTTMRVVLCPERNEEVFDPVRLDSSDFAETLLQLGHSPAVHLFTYDLGKSKQRTSEGLVIQQLPPHRGAGYSELVCLEIWESGCIIVDANVTGRVDRAHGNALMDSFVLAEEDVEEVLHRSMAFAGAVYDQFDPYKRHQRFLVNVSLAGIGRRELVRDPKPQPSYESNSIFGIEEPVLAYKSPRLIARADLYAPQAEIARLLSTFRRAIEVNQPPV